ncbi:alpha-amlyase [Bacillus sp. FJAT-42376]|uniref:alpha-amylase family glycosyl hydrolase n=1 Tax=Bacillus sp. FJAT-42376 TaxID=2014076 RepID=UPI000F4F246F|nr:alpha-amylase family glycosyl hydrolase [Bacillus sp. FJAT-42376]AZB42321.1 alpha-amlyase [Bacillus sp. FJAT-42376]
MKTKWIMACLAFLMILPLGPAAAAEEKDASGWQDERIYFLMVDRFANGDPMNDFDADREDPAAYHGGDFKGITKKLDYIKDMGFTAIWLTPVFDNEGQGYHGYWISDFRNTDEHFGTMEEFKTLVKEAHKRNIKVLLDFVVNHTGKTHKWLNDPGKKDWFHEQKEITNWENQDELENNWLYGLPDLNQENPDTRKYLLDTAKWWIRETDIDGYRLDTVRHVPKDFWRDFSKEVKSVKKDFFLLGEVWSDDPAYLAEYEKTGIDSFVDYPFYEEASEIFSKSGQSAGPLIDVWKRNEHYYQSPYLLGTFLDNHDNIRFTRKALINQEPPGIRWKLGLTYLFTAPGIPIVYYGSEIALDGAEDPDNRRMMDFRADEELISYITKLNNIRGHEKALVYGDMEKLYDQKGMTVFKRTYKGETAVIAINNSDQTAKVKIPSDQLAKAKELNGYINGEMVKEKGGKYELILNRETAEVFKMEDPTGPHYGIIAATVSVPILFIGFLYAAGRRRRRPVQ